MSRRLKNPNTVASLRGKVLWPGIAFSAAALVVAVYLAWISISGGATAGCGPNSGCQELLATRWAYWFGLPVSGLAAGMYAFFLILVASLMRATPASNSKRSWMLVLGCAFLMICAALWFTSLQVFVLKRFCPYCLTAHACSVAAAVFVLRQAPIGRSRSKSEAKPKPLQITPHETGWLMIGSLGLLALLIAGQTLYQPKNYAVRTLPPVTEQHRAAKAARFFSIYEGRFQLNLGEEPLSGDPAASNIVVSLFDYSCPHCRDTHGYLAQALQAFSNQLAVVNLVMPLDGSCNRIIKKTNPMHVNACEYGHIGLAVWRANWRLAGKFDDWMFSSETPPTPEAARKHAAELVGQAAFEQSLRDQWIAQEIARNVDIFQAGLVQDKKGMMPQLIIGSKFVSGPLNRLSELDGLLAQEFGLKKP